MGAVNVLSQLMALKMAEIYFKCFKCVQWKLFWFIHGKWLTNIATHLQEGDSANQTVPIACSISETVGPMYVHVCIKTSDR